MVLTVLNVLTVLHVLTVLLGIAKGAIATRHVRRCCHFRLGNEGGSVLLHQLHQPVSRGLLGSMALVVDWGAVGHAAGQPVGGPSVYAPCCMDTFGATVQNRPATSELRLHDGGCR